MTCLASAAVIAVLGLSIRRVKFRSARKHRCLTPSPCSCDTALLAGSIVENAGAARRQAIDGYPSPGPGHCSRASPTV